VSICSDSLAALNAFRPLEQNLFWFTMSKGIEKYLYLACGRTFWVPGHAEERSNEIADGLARGGTALRVTDPGPALGVSRRYLQKCSVSGWPTNTWPNGEILVISKGKLESLSRHPFLVEPQNR